ncbi:hypothetical protein QWY87_11465 [Lutimonas halocynthiae]|uniref:hypothetical protein n=1 Tax=Lutimonas halocynthiae TaxID=1446477 RepID=UPI0025B5A581|nr:hypothetical protein [Lutimonas halocynthiae]MDN3643324.1 hypothetical protein [Lutimonas halocynthiae]
MKQFFLLCFIVLFTSCAHDKSSPEEILDSHPYLIGEWSGVGGFMHVDFAKSMGEVPVEINIAAYNNISAKIGEAHLIQIEIAKANYGIELRGVLDARIKETIDFEKDHVVFLLVLPDENRQNLKVIDANFHVKSNYAFDFGMRVGGVMLRKQE